MIEDILVKTDLHKDDIITLLQIEDRSELILLYERADEVRKQFCGDAVHLRGIIEFSNFCEQDCLYCGLRKSNRKLKRYRMRQEEILQTARIIYHEGIRTIVLQTGEDFDYTGEEIEDIIVRIKEELDVAITLSLGERNFREYKIWKDAGADRYLLKHETANAKLYSTYHSGQRLQERVDHLLHLKSLGYQIGSGNLVGLPQQSVSDIADDILLCNELDVDMASFSPFIPSPNTPYRNQRGCEVNFILKVMAVGRIALKNAHIPATTALGTLDQYGREKGLQVGANVIMPNFTPAPYREQYAIYPDKKCVNDNPQWCSSCLGTMVSSLGRKIAVGQGHSLKS
jgi:biotin synthase